MSVPEYNITIRGNCGKIHASFAEWSACRACDAGSIAGDVYPFQRPPKPARVYDLDTAIKAYWSSTSRREDVAAYHQILLFGGIDGYPSHGEIRTTIARWLRKLALRIGGPS